MTHHSRPRRFSSLARAGALTATLLLCVAVVSPMSSVANGVPLQVTAVDVVGLTVSDMDRALTFYTDVLPFSKVSDVELSGRAYELLSGVFGARTRVAR